MAGSICREPALQAATRLVLCVAPPPNQRGHCGAQHLGFPRQNVADDGSTGAANVLDERNFGVFDLVCPSGTSELLVCFYQLIHAGHTDRGSQSN